MMIDRRNFRQHTFHPMYDQSQQHHMFYSQQFPANHLPYYHNYYPSIPQQQAQPFTYMQQPSRPPIGPYQPNVNPQQRPPFNGQPFTANIMQQFQDADGQVDINKMLSTVGQLANTVQQVSPMIKQFGTFVSGFRK